LRPALPEPEVLAPGAAVRLYEEAVEAVRRPDRPESLDRAIDIFQRLLASDEGSARAHAGLARAYWEKAVNPAASGDPVFLEQAAAVAREAVRLDPDLADARVSLGLAEHAQGRPEEARIQLETALGMDPDSAHAQADAHYGLARLALSQGRAEEAEARYRQALDLQPRAMYWDALGALLYSQGRYAEAEEAFLASLERTPDNAYALRNLGVAYYAQGRLDEATARLEEALEIRPDASVFSNLGTIYFSRGLYAHAASTFERALRMDGAANSYAYWLNLADAQRWLPDRAQEAQRSYRRAIQLLDAAIEAAPEDVRVLSRRAVAQARSGDFHGTLEDVTEARRLGIGDDVYSLLRLAVAEELCGERESALATLGEALRAGLAPSEVRNEPDLLELRADPAFHHLLMDLEDSSEPLSSAPLSSDPVSSGASASGAL
jgi:serine/threonine-protein kinase